MEGKLSNDAIRDHREWIELSIYDLENRKKGLLGRLQTLKGLCAHDDIIGETCMICGEDRREKLKGEHCD